MKKIAIVFFLTVIALASTVVVNTSHASTIATVSIDSSTQQFPSATVGSTIQVNIDVNNVQDLWLWDITNLTFNPAYLNITSVTEGPFLKSAGKSLFVWTSNSNLQFSEGYIPDITDILLEYSTASGTGVLATLTFQVLALGESQITFKQTTLESDTNLGTSSDPNYQQIPCTTVNANIVVGSNASSSTPTPTSPPAANSGTPTPIDPSTSTSSAPTSSQTGQIPEFPLFPVIVILFIASMISMLIFKKVIKPKRK